MSLGIGSITYYILLVNLKFSSCPTLRNVKRAIQVKGAARQLERRTEEDVTPRKSN